MTHNEEEDTCLKCGRGDVRIMWMIFCYDYLCERCFTHYAPDVKDWNLFFEEGTTYKHIWGHNQPPQLRKKRAFKGATKL